MKNSVKYIVTVLSLVLCTVVHAQIPEVDLFDIDGNKIKTSTLKNENGPLIISFFATWCKPCLRELKAIDELYPDWQEETGVELIAVSIDEFQNSEKVRTLFSGSGWEFKILLDPNGEFKRKFGITPIPATVIIDKKGKVVHKHIGYIDGEEYKLYDKLLKCQ